MSDAKASFDMKDEVPERLQTHELLRDRLNVELLQRLAADPRTSVSGLARGIGMSPPAVRERLARLEDAGIVRGVRLDLDPARLGWPVQAYVRVRPMPGQLSKVAELAAALPQVAECHRITGEDCFILRIYLESIASLDQVLDRFLAHGQTTTSIVQSTVVQERAPPLPAATPADRSGRQAPRRPRTR
jgi:Lrp/AsnC family leucine-responsive transcriptional regulator